MKLQIFENLNNIKYFINNSYFVYYNLPKFFNNHFYIYYITKYIIDYEIYYYARFIVLSGKKYRI